jgi:hypothetical protein
MNSEDEIQEYLASYPWDKHKDIEKKAWLHKSQIIEASLMVETLLVATISHLLVGQDYPRFRLLRHLVFDAEFCTFMQLRKMLSIIYSIFGDKITCLTKEESKKLRSEINNIIKVRNMFAHGSSDIDADTNKYTIRYYDNGIVLKKISDNYVNNFLKNCTETNKNLSILNEFFRENPLRIDTEELRAKEVKPE